MQNSTKKHVVRLNKRNQNMDSVVRSIRETRGLSAEIARACGIERAAVYQWAQVPPHWVTTVAKIIGKKPERIRPDIFKRGRE